MGHMDALSRLPEEIMIVDDNSFELNLALNQNRDSKLVELKKILWKTDNSYLRWYCVQISRNDIVKKTFRKTLQLLFYVSQTMEL